MGLGCVIDGCGEPRVGRGWCRKHYMRWSRTGDPLVTRKAGNGSVTSCAVDDCDSTGRFIQGHCEKHYVRIRTHGDVNAVRYATGPRPQARGASNPMWIGDACGYDGMHDRLKVRRGLAAGQPCTRCPGVAEEWAYDHTDPDERVDVKRGFPYSLDPDRYMPLCVPCHRTLDAPARVSA